MHVDNSAPTLRLKAVVEADAGAVVRVLHFFQVRNIVPRRVVAQRSGTDYVEVDIELDAEHLAPDVFRAIVAKISQLPIVMAVVICD